MGAQLPFGLDPEIVAILAAFGLALVPVGLAFRRRSARVVLVATWIAVCVAATPGLRGYRIAHAVVEPNDRPLERVRGDYVGSKECIGCHPHEYDTWKHTWHRTMTQVASPESVLGDFDDVELETDGWKTRLERDGDRFYAHVYDAAKRRYVRRQIVLTTGSHHMQAYWYARGPDRPLGQLQFTWVKDEAQWVPRTAVFVIPPSPTPTDETGRWNTVCIGCHTTRGRPGMNHEHAPIAESDAVEFGIACEACHGPGGEHVAANRANPARRYTKHLSDGGDDTIVNASKLSKERSAEVCGQCHGISDVPHDVAGFFRSGYDYRAGEVLDDTGRSILRGGENYPRASSERSKAYHDTLFWSDGMVRVSGREVNGLYDSPCFERGEMTCLSCHRLHKDADDPRPYEQWADDMLSPGMRTDLACLQCHETFAQDIAAHTHHPAGSTGSECMNCHMPYTTWGLRKAIRQHTIDSPTVAATVESGRLNACNACHVDQTLAWTAERMDAWYGHDRPALSADQETYAASLLWLLEGDAGQRALSAWYLGWEPAQAVAGRDWIAPHLAPLLDDPYDVVRYVAARSLRGLPGHEALAYDYVGPETDRKPVVRKVLDRYASRPAESVRGDRAARLLLYEDGSLDRISQGRLIARRDDRDVTLSE